MVQIMHGWLQNSSYTPRIYVQQSWTSVVLIIMLFLMKVCILLLALSSTLTSVVAVPHRDYTDNLIYKLKEVVQTAGHYYDTERGIITQKPDPEAKLCSALIEWLRSNAASYICPTEPEEPEPEPEPETEPVPEPEGPCTIDRPECLSAGNSLCKEPCRRRNGDLFSSCELANQRDRTWEYCCEDRCNCKSFTCSAGDHQVDCSSYDFSKGEGLYTNEGLPCLPDHPCGVHQWKPGTFWCYYHIGGSWSYCGNPGQCSTQTGRLHN